MIKWFGLVSIISCLTINLITGQFPFSNQNDYPTNVEIQQQSTIKSGHDQQIDLKTIKNDNEKTKQVNDITQTTIGPLPLNQQQLINPVIRSSTSNSDSNKKETSIEQQSTAIKSKDDGEFKTLDEILSLAGLADVESMVPSSEPRSFMIKTRFKTKETSEKDEDDEKEEKEEKEVKKTKKKSTKKKSKKKSSKKSSKKSKKKSKKKKSKKKKKKKKKSCGCCCCCCK